MINFISRGPLNGLKKKVVVLLGAVVLVGAIGAGLYFYQPVLTQILTQSNLFDGFSKLVLSRENIQDNFKLTAVLSDSIGVEPISSYVLTSKEAVSTIDIKNNLTVTPDVGVTVNQTADREWEIVPNEPLPPNSLLKVVLASTYVDQAGAEQVRNYEWAFQVKDTFKVLNSIPRDVATNVPINTGIEVTFSHDNFSNYEQFFTIEPAVSGRFEKHGRTLVYVPEALESGRIYRVTVKKGLPLANSNETLGEDYSFAFETQVAGQYNQAGTWLHVYEKLQDFNTNEPPLVRLSSRGLKDNALEVLVFPLRDESQYLQMLAKRDELPAWAYAKDYYLTETKDLQALSSFKATIQEERNIQFIRFPEKLPRGYYLVEFKNGDTRDQAWLQITDVAAYVTVANNKTIIWATDIAAKKVVASGQVELIGTGKKFPITNQGTAVFDTPAELTDQSSNQNISQRYYFRISSDNGVLIIPATYLSRGYGYGYWDAGGSGIDYWNYLYTDRPLYQPTDTIKLWGLLKDRDGVPINDEVKVTLYKDGYVDYYYRPILISEQAVTVDALGVFSGEIKVNDLHADWYTLQLSVGGKVIQTKYIEIRPYVKPAYQLSLVPDKRTAFAGEEVKLRGQATFFEGTPVPDLAVVLDTPEGPQKAVTNADGVVEFSYRKNYSDCNTEYGCWPSYSWLSLKPELAEFGDIEANASLNFFGPRVYATTKVVYPAKGRGQVTIKTRQVDLQKAQTGGRWEEDWMGSQIAPGSKVEGEVIKITHTSTEIGTFYDFISKRTYKKYSYSTKEETVDRFSGTTNAEGVYVYERDIQPETSYRVKLKVFDGTGKYDTRAEYLYYYDGAALRQYNQSDFDFYRLKLPTVNKFSIGEPVAIDFVKNEESLPDGGSNYYLFMQYQNGLQEYQVSQNSNYAFGFESRDVPNVNVSGVYFNGETFIVSQTAWEGNSILFDVADKTLGITITPDKAQYQPGETVQLSVKTVNAKGVPVSAAVNLNLIDEAFYAVMDTEASPIDSIYAGIGTGTIFSTYSHRRPVSPFGGAEKGGCFLPGTKILMADNTSKNIEDVALGDQVLTMGDPRGHEKVVGTVSELYRHTVSEYRIINKQLRVTPEHLVYANLQFKPAGDLKIGDWLLGSDGKKVYVTSIEIKREIVPVYNFRVEPQHTYFADGYFVHNEKGGGPREFFTDAALFETVTTNSAGQGQTTFVLPDNITSWRVTAQGISAGLDVGVSTSKIPVSLPVFLEATIGQEYITGDQPTVRLRSFGSALRSGDSIDFSLLSPDLGITEAQKKISSAFKSEFFPLPQLSRGTYSVTYGLKSARGDDAIKLPLEVIDSRLLVSSAKTQDATEGVTIKNDTNSHINLLFADRARSTIYTTLRSLSWSWGGRIDQVLGRVTALKILNDAFEYQYTVPEFPGSQYQVQSGGLTLLPYSSEDLELSARVASLQPVGFDNTALTQYFLRKLEDRASNRQEITAALYGLAALHQPVLPRLEAWLMREDLTVKEKLYGALALYELGEGEAARAIYWDIVDQYAQVKEPHIIIKAGETDDEVLENTALTAVLAAYLNEPQQYGLWDYLSYNRPKEVLLTLEALHILRAHMSILGQQSGSVTLDVDGKKVEHKLERPRFSYTVDVAPNDTVKVVKATPNVVVTTTTPVPLSQSGLQPDLAISISREYYVKGKKTETFKENDLIEVRLTPKFQGSALDGDYQVTDTLPSGLVPVTNLYHQYGAQNDCHYWYPYNQEGQRVSYMISKNWNTWGCAGYIKYYARVRTKGSYRAEPAVVQSMLNPDFINFTPETKITIE